MEILSKTKATCSFIKNNPSMMHKYLVPDTRFWHKFYMNTRKIFFLKEFILRKKLYNKYFSNKTYKNNSIEKLREDGCVIDSNYKKSNFLLRALKICDDLVQNTNWIEESSKSKKPFLIELDIDLKNKTNFDIMNLVLEKPILGLVSKYFKKIPILRDINIWYSPNNKVYGRSQNFHTDGGDEQLRLFIPIENISLQNGPFTCIKKNSTTEVFNDLKKKNVKKFFNTPIQTQKIPDDIILENNPDTVNLVGKRGELLFADPCSCLHYGSRLSNKPRIQLSLNFMSNLAMDNPLWGMKINFDFFSKINFNEDYKNILAPYVLSYYFSDPINRGKNISNKPEKM